MNDGTKVSDLYADFGIEFFGSNRYREEDGDPILPFSGEVALTHLRPGGVRASTTGTNNGVIGAVFLDPITGNLATTSQVGAYMFTHQLDNRAFLQLDAFGLNGGLLESLQTFGGGENKFLGLHRDEGIHQVRFFTGWLDNIRQGDGFNLDNFTFESVADSGIAGPPITPAIPEPSSILLFGLGLLGVIGWRGVKGKIGDGSENRGRF